jgi:hypothetical protein
MASRASTRITRNRVRVPGVVGDATVIELAIPMLDTGATQCHICASAFCPSHECARSPTHLACCTQTICTGCLVKMCKRCRCADDCAVIVAFCPYCREVSPVPSLDIFRGTQTPCSGCSDSSDSEGHPQHATVEGPRRGRPETRGRSEPRADPPGPRPLSAASAVDSSESLLRYIMT